jgi:hypothetical protein
MPGIFISYRRDDSAGYAGRLYDALASQFGKTRVFMDLDTIRPGEDFVRLIRERVAACDVLIALIGRNWLKSVDDRGLPRLQNPEDLVRLEIAHALELGIRVIPVLVAGASMPPASELPSELKPLSTRNALEIHDALFRESVGRLVNELKTGNRGHSFVRRSLRFQILAGTAGVALIVGLAVTLAPGSKAPSQVEKTATDAVPDLDRLLSAPVKPIKVQTPVNMRRLPAIVDDARAVSEPPGRHDVSGPRGPKLAWAAQVTTGDAWNVVGIADDGTVFIWDAERTVLSAVSNGSELWAYKSASPMGWSLDGFDADGRVWLSGRDAGPQRPRIDDDGLPVISPRFIPVAFCFNSKGEGGQVVDSARLRTAHPANNSVEGLGACEGGRVQKQNGARWTVELDGNCPNWGVAHDDKGNLYTSSDAGTFYSIAPNGSIRWTTRLGFQTHRPFFLFDDVVFGSEQGLFRLHDGAPRWKFSTSGSVMDQSSAPVFDRTGAIYFSDYTTVLAVDNAGKLLWKYGRGSPLALDQKGRLYIKSDRGIACLAD